MKDPKYNVGDMFVENFSGTLCTFYIYDWELDDDTYDDWIYSVRYNDGTDSHYLEEEFEQLLKNDENFFKYFPVVK